MKSHFLRRIRLRTITFTALLALGAAPSLHAFDWMANSRAQEQCSALIQQAYAAHESGNSAQALALLDQADKLRANVADSANLRGAVYLRQGVYDKAEVAFSRAVACDPKLWAARFNLAEVPFRKKDYARARARFDSLVTQTNRFKEQNQWELAQYKAVLCSLLLHDDAGLQKRLAKLPEGAAAATPARLCAEAALALTRKDNAAATRLLSGLQQGKFSASTTALFVSALEISGWLPSVPNVNAAALAARSNHAPPGNGSLMPGHTTSAALPFNLPIPGSEPELPTADGSVPAPAPPQVHKPAPSPAPAPESVVATESQTPEIQPDP